MDTSGHSSCLFHLEPCLLQLEPCLLQLELGA